MILKDSSTEVKFWYPSTGSFEDALSSVILRAPEEGNTETRERNQSIARTRAGNTIVYDRGNNFNTNFSLQFRYIPDSQRAALIVFLETVQWASTKVIYQDMYGVTYVVRVFGASASSINGLTYEDNGGTLKRGLTEISWNFKLDLLNLNDNLEELETLDTPVTGALSLHLLDFDEPHNPETCVTINSADGAVSIEGFLTTDWRSIIWTVLISKGADSATYLIICNHNRNGDTDATTVTLETVVLNEVGDVASHVTFSAPLTLAGSLQIMSLACDTNADDWRICVRRSKMAG